MKWMKKPMKPNRLIKTPRFLIGSAGINVAVFGKAIDPKSVGIFGPEGIIIEDVYISYTCNTKKEAIAMTDVWHRRLVTGIKCAASSNQGPDIPLLCLTELDISKKITRKQNYFGYDTRHVKSLVFFDVDLSEVCRIQEKDINWDWKQRPDVVINGMEMALSIVDEYGLGILYSHNSNHAYCGCMGIEHWDRYYNMTQKELEAMTERTYCGR